MPHHSTLVGRRFGKLTVEKQVPKPSSVGKRATYWLCRCDCKTALIVRRDALTSGRTASCGCLHNERLGAASTTHGMSRSPTYDAWHSMLQRCENPTSRNWKYYGARGIKVCDRWHSFESFFEDMGEKPSGLSLERADVNGNYEPSNCTWATASEQMRNRRDSRYITANGIRRHLNEWATELGITPERLWSRIQKLGWSPEDAVSIQPSRRRSS